MNVKTNLDYLKGFVSDNQMKEYSDKVESVLMSFMARQEPAMISSDG